MITWLCPKPESPSGGVWLIHRLSGLLNELGKPSQVAHLEPFGVWWDHNPVTTPVIDGLPLTFSAGDTVVIPEVTWQTHPLLNNGVRSIVFIQNYIWASAKPEDYQGAEVLVCSRFLYNWSKRVLGIAPIGIATPYLDDGPWRVTPKTKDRTLLFERRNPYARAMAEALAAADFPVDLVTEPLSQDQLAERFDAAEFYVHLTSPEGFPMVCAEAMSSGVIPCGTTGGGGNEFMFDQETAMVVQDPTLGHYDGGVDGGQAEFVLRVMAKMLALRADAKLREKLWKQGQAWVAGRYTRARTCEQLSKLF